MFSKRKAATSSNQHAALIKAKSVRNGKFQHPKIGFKETCLWCSGRKGFPRSYKKIDFSFEKKSDEEVEIADYAFTKACNFDEFIY